MLQVVLLLLMNCEKNIRGYENHLVRGSPATIGRDLTKTEEIVVTSVWDCRSDPKILIKNFVK